MPTRENVCLDVEAKTCPCLATCVSPPAAVFGDVTNEGGHRVKWRREHGLASTNGRTYLQFRNGQNVRMQCGLQRR